MRCHSAQRTQVERHSAAEEAVALAAGDEMSSKVKRTGHRAIKRIARTHLHRYRNIRHAAITTLRAFNGLVLVVTTEVLRLVKFGLFIVADCACSLNTDSDRDMVIGFKGNHVSTIFKQHLNHFPTTFRPFYRFLTKVSNTTISTGWFK